MRTEEMGVFAESDRGMWTAASLLTLLSTALLFSSCQLFDPQTPAAPVNDVVALVADDSGSASAGVHVFYNDGHGNLSVGPVLQGNFNNATVSSGYTDLALGDISGHSATSGGGSLIDGVTAAVNDIFVTNDNVGPNEVWINDGSGNFSLHSEPWSTQSSTAVVLGQIFGVSGEVDAFVANETSYPTIWQNSEKDGAFTEYTIGEGQFRDVDYNSTYVSPLPDTVALGMGALSGSGGTSADIFTGNLGQQDHVYQDESGSLGSYGNTTTDGSTATSDYTHAVAVGDLNGDGLPDVFVANGGSTAGSGGQNFAYFNSHSGGANVLQQYSVGSTPNDSTAVAIGDLTGSGTMYVFVVNNGAADTVWKYNGSNGFTQVTESSQFNNATDTTGTAVTLADLNGDGILDAIVASGGSSGTIQVWIGNGGGTFTQLKEPNIPSGNYVAVASGRLR